MIQYYIAAKIGAGFANGFLKSIQSTQEAKAQAQVYANQAALYRQNAKNSRLTGSLNEDMMRSQQRAVLAQGSAAAGEAGMGESPTAMKSLATAAGALEQNILNSRYQVESEAENYLYQAAIADENARQMRKKAKHGVVKAMVGGTISAFS